MDHNAVQSISILRDIRPERFLGREGGRVNKKTGFRLFRSVSKISICEKNIRGNSYLVKYSIVNNTINALISNHLSIPFLTSILPHEFIVL